MNPVFTGLSLSLLGVRPPLVLGTFVPRWHSAADGPARRGAWLTAGKQWALDALARLQQSRAAGLLICAPEAISRIADPARHRDHIFEVPHGIDLSRFPPRTGPPPRPSVLFLANVIRRKGIFTLLEAFERVAREVPDVELVIAGGGGDMAAVQAQVAAMHGLRVRILGRVDRAGVPALMREHSIYCLPSYGEPFATSILEAMACGVPVVATRAGGVPHLISDDGGRLVPPRDPAALAEALIEILRSPACNRRWGSTTAPGSSATSRPRWPWTASRRPTPQFWRRADRAGDGPRCRPRHACWWGAACRRAASGSRCHDRGHHRRLRLRQWRRGPHRARERQGPGRPRSRRGALHRRRPGGRGPERRAAPAHHLPRPGGRVA